MTLAGSVARRRLILVRHAPPEIRADVPAAAWRLSAAGAARARDLAARVQPAGGDPVFTSVEPKAVETAEALAAAWGLAVEQVSGLHEHVRPEAQLLSREEFEAKVRRLFARPTEMVFGAETADQARRRFTAAVLRILARTEGDAVIVSHGTVMALFVATATGADPFSLWKRQQMPCALTLALPELRLEGITLLTP